MTCILRALLAALCLLLPGAAFGQGAVLQGGPWTPGRVPMYVGQSTSQTVIMDGGSAAGGAVGTNISELGITARGTGAPPYIGAGPYGTNICDYDAPTNSADGYHFLCFSPNAQGGGLIAYGAAGGASQLPLAMLINGTRYEFPFALSGVVGPDTTIVGDLACWNNTSGTLLSDCTTLPSGITITSPTITTPTITSPIITGGASISGDLTLSGPIPWIDVTAPPYNAKIDGVTDDTAAFKAAIAAATGKSQTVYVPCVNNGTAVISDTLVLGAGVNFQTCPGGSNQSYSVWTGISLKWAGASNLPMIKIFGAYHTSLKGFILDCDSVPGCIGVQYASNNSPSSSYNEISDITVRSAHIGYVQGDPTTTLPPITPPATIPLCVTFSNLNCAQADSMTVTRFNVVGNGTDTTAEAVHINDANGLQSSHWYQSNFQNVSIGFHILWNNGNLVIESTNGGNPVGAKTFILRDTFSLVPPTLINNETEGSWTYAVRDLSNTQEGALPTYRYPFNVYYNQWNNPVSCEGNGSWVSIGNSGGGQTGNPWNVGGNCYVLSMMESTNNGTTQPGPWVESGSGQVSYWGVQSGETWLQARNIIAGKTPAGLPIGSGNLAASTDGVTNQGRITLGSDGTTYIQRSSTQISVTGSGFSAGVSPSGLVAGDLGAARSGSSSVVWLGSDGNSYVQRTGNNVNIVQPGTLSTNGALVSSYETGSWTPILRFGGATTGITYSTQSGLYTRVGKFVYLSGKILLSSKGSATGVAQITGLPLTSNTVSAGGAVAYAQAFSGLAGAIQLGLNVAGSDVISLTSSGTTGSTILTDEVFTGTTRLDFSLTYQIP